MKRFNSFYTGQPYKAELKAKPITKDGKTECQLVPEIELSNMVPGPCDVKSSGVINSECINPGRCQWFSCGHKECVPKDCGCIYVGSYCGTYVWITSSRGRDELAKLTLAILDYAQNSNRPLPTKEVVAYLTADGRPTNQASANIVIKTQIAASDVSASVLGPDIDARRKLEECLHSDMSAELNSKWADLLAAPEANRPALEAEMNEIQDRQSMDYIQALPAPLYVPEQPMQPQLQLQIGPQLQRLDQQLDLLR